MGTCNQLSLHVDRWSSPPGDFSLLPMPPSAAPPTPQEIQRKLSVHSASRRVCCLITSSFIYWYHISHTILDSSLAQSPTQIPFCLQMLHLPIQYPTHHFPCLRSLRSLALRSSPQGVAVKTLTRKTMTAQAGESPTMAPNQLVSPRVLEVKRE